MTFRPNLSAKLKKGESYDTMLPRTLQKSPCDAVYMSPKLDGIRCIMHPDYGPVSRTLKAPPNRHLQEMILNTWDTFKGLDGEFVWGNHESPAYSFQTTFSKWSNRSDADISQMRFHVFDELSPRPFEERWLSYFERLQNGPQHDHLRMVHQLKVGRTLEDIYDALDRYLDRFYEGAMLRLGGKLYKNGRSTMLEGGLIALKPMEDSEGIIIGFEEMEHNTNKAEIDALGYTKRSSSMAGKVPAGTLGKLICRPHPKCRFFGGKDITFKVGSGFDMGLRQEIWDNREKWLGDTITYKFQRHGVKDKPRAPIFKGRRSHDLD